MLRIRRYVFITFNLCIRFLLVQKIQIVLHWRFIEMSFPSDFLRRSRMNWSAAQSNSGTLVDTVLRDRFFHHFKIIAQLF